MPLPMAQKPQTNPRPRRLTPCHRHPNIPTTTGLCAPCLHERLALLNPSAASTSSSSSTSAAATQPELRRCKTFSAKNRQNSSSSFEPRRRSCDVRSNRNTLSTLFDLDDDVEDVTLKVESSNVGSLTKASCPVPELMEEDEEEIEEDDIDIEVARVSNLGNSEVVVVDEEDEFEESKTMKEFIDLELEANSSNSKPSSKTKDFKEIAGSFWVAASVFSKKLRKWRKNEKSKRENSVARNAGGCVQVGLGEMRLEDLRGRRLRDTQSEVGFGRRSCDTDPRGLLDYGRASIDGCAFGRRSCDTDPRFSIDLGRASVDCGSISIDEGRCSIEAPRASWDGYLIGGRTSSRGSAPMVSVIENAMATVYGFDHRVLAEGKMKVDNNGDRRNSTGSLLMKDHYLESDSLQRCRKGLNRSGSVNRDMAMAENGESNSSSNGRVSPAAIGIFNGTKLLITEKELNEWRLNSVKDDSSESFETASKDLASVSSSSNGQGFKKCRQWTKLWGIWGLLHRKKGGDKCDDEEKLERRNGSCQHTGSAASSTRNGVGEAGPDPDWKLARSHSTASSRGSSSAVVGSARETMSKTESKAIVKRRQEDVRLDRNRSSRFSPNHLDNGLLRFYLTPLRSRRRSKLGKSRLKNSRSLARSVLRL